MMINGKMMMIISLWLWCDFFLKACAFISTFEWLLWLHNHCQGVKVNTEGSKMTILGEKVKIIQSSYIGGIDNQIYFYGLGAIVSTIFNRFAGPIVKLWWPAAITITGTTFGGLGGHVWPVSPPFKHFFCPISIRACHHDATFPDSPFQSLLLRHGRSTTEVRAADMLHQ